MARQRIDAGAEKYIEVKDVNGNLVKIPAPTPLTEPQKDDDLGYVPEFVNISGKVQQIAVPGDSDATKKILRYGILRGAQWRMLADPKVRVWGKHPPFVERVAKDGKFDEKYLLTEEQMVREIEALTDRRRIQDLIDNARIADPEGDEFGDMPNQKISENRMRENRPMVSEAALNRSFNLEEVERKRKEELGLVDHG